MSVRLLGKAFYADLPAHLKFLLVALCDEASEDGKGISVGQKRLGMKCGTSERSVRSNLAQLRERGWIVDAGRDPKYRTTRHEIVVEKLGITPEEVAGQGPEEVAGRSGQPEVERRPDRKLSVPDTGSGLPPTQELPVTTTQELELIASDFAVFWAVYPRHEGRATAETSWGKVMRSSTTAGEVLAGAARYRDDPNREAGYTLHASTWLNQERWNDDPLPARTGRPKRVSQANELLRQAMEG